MPRCFRRIPALTSLLVMLLLSGCLTVTNPPADTSGGAPGAGREKKLVNGAVMSELVVLFHPGAGALRGRNDVENLLHARLSIVDPTGQLQPQLAEAVPSIEN